MPEDPSLDLRRTGDPVAAVDGPLAVTDRAGGVRIPAGGSNPAARYLLGEEMARGGMGVVHRATDTVLGREVAVKVLKEKYAPDSGTARRFADEARITGQLQHPNIPAVHDLGVLPDGRPFLAMKLIKGDTLEDLLKRRADPAEGRGRFVAAFEQVCQAVAYAHAHDVIHRDLKPANVMVGAFGEVQVMDWGLAKVLGARPEGRTDPEETTAPTAVLSLRESDDPLTRAGSVLGTPAFMPPEQAAGAVATIDRRSDVFGLGAVLAVVLTGRPPFVADTSESARVKAAQGDMSECFARLGACGADPDLVALCQRCLAPRPEDRPKDAGEVAKAVAALRAAADERARQAELDRVKAAGERAAAELRAAEQRKRRKVQLALAAAVMVVLAGGGAGLWWADRQAAERRHEREVAAARARQAAETALDQADAALRAGRMAEADVALAQAELRLADAPADGLRDRHYSIKADRDMVRELDRLAELGLRWDNADVYVALPATIRRGAYPEAFQWYGLAVGDEPAAGTAAKVRTSRIAGPLVDGLNLWFFYEPARPGLRAAVDAADPDPFRAEVRAARAAGDRDRVRKLLAGADGARLTPGFVVGLRMNAVQEGDRLRVMEAAWAAHPDSYPIALHLSFLSAVASTSRTQAAEALGWARAAVALRPDNAVPYITLGDAHRALGDPTAAAAAYRRAIQLDPTYFMPHNSLAQALQQGGDPDAAIAEFRKCLELNPRFGRVYPRLFNLLADKKDWAGAEALCRQMTEVLPDQPFGHNGLGVALLNTDRPRQALDLLSRVLAAHPDWAADFQIPLRYNAACAAAVCAAGKGADVPPPADRPACRRQALDLLAGDLAAFRKLFADEPGRRASIHAQMRNWLQDSDLEPVRERAALEKIPADEQAAWVGFWAAVGELRDATAPPEGAPPPGEVKR
jgi:eukaryotic-like serine/threonine-protein kinase